MLAGTQASRDLPSDVHRRILDSPSLTLCDLGRLGRTSRLFQGILSQRCAADQLWLEEAATAAFGRPVVEGLLRLFMQPLEASEISIDSFVEAASSGAEGAGLPTPAAAVGDAAVPLKLHRAHYLSLEAPACGLQSPQQISIVAWRMDPLGPSFLHETGLARV